MSQITINTINGIPPYSIYVCTPFLLNCNLVSSGVTTLPFSFESPSAYTNSPSVLVKIIDSQNCEFTQVYNCITLTPTPSVTVTPSYTPSNTATPFVTPSVTQTSYSPTPTPTNTVTPSFTTSPTPTPTPNPTPIFYNNSITALLVIEPLTASTIIGNYMQSQGVNFFGFSNGVAPSTNQVDFENEMNTYLSYSGWTSGELPAVQILNYPTVPYPTGNDTYGNQMTSYNFLTRRISASTISGPAWYTFFISSAYTNGMYQKSIDVGTQSQNIFTEVNNNSVYYNIDFELIQNVYTKSPYTRMYTTFPSEEFLLDNSKNLYFKGSTIGI
jgi:hypothetical protein